MVVALGVGVADADVFGEQAAANAPAAAVVERVRKSLRDNLDMLFSSF
jgi:hypothetical protein